VYAEKIGFKAGNSYDAQTSPSESVKMLSSVAKEIQTWIVGGKLASKDITGIATNE